MKYIISLCLAVVITAIMITITIKKEMLEIEKERAALDYYQNVETLLDSLYIDCGDTILETDAGAKYLDSKYTFDSLFINR